MLAKSKRPAALLLRGVFAFMTSKAQKTYRKGRKGCFAKAAEVLIYKRVADLNARNVLQFAMAYKQLIVKQRFWITVNLKL